MIIQERIRTSEQMVELFQRVTALLDPNEVDFSDTYDVNRIHVSYKRGKEEKNERHLAVFRITRYGEGHPGKGVIFVTAHGDTRYQLIIAQLSLIFKFPTDWLGASERIRFVVHPDQVQIYRDVDMLRVPQ